MAAQPFITPSSALDRRRLGKFEVLCRLSAGGMSEIFLATQSGIAGFRKLVVLKTILPDIGGEEDFVRMFLDEARTTAAFNHPNIAQVYELDVDDGTLFMAMEFVPGCTLVEMARACRQAKEPIPIGFTLQSVRDTALALHYAHTFTDHRGRKQVVIHRDVAEKNIMVTYEGVTKLLDFGIAKATGRAGRTNVGMVKGTSGYMSPEQIRGEPLDGRSDVFALGVVLHECLTGMRLFHGKNAEEGMMAALRDTVAPPSKQNPAVLPDIDAVVMKSLARKREDRFGTALEMARAIERAAPGLIWHPEQSGELVMRHFAERRGETRRLLESTSYANESTGEIRIENVMARVKAGQSAAAAEQARTAAEPPAPVPPKVDPPPAQKATPPVVMNPQRSARGGTDDVQTVAARPKIAREPAPLPPLPPLRTADVVIEPPAAIPQHSVTVSAPGPAPVSLLTEARAPDPGYDDEAKTIPAAAIPDEIRALRKKLGAPLPTSKPRPTTPEPAPATAPAAPPPAQPSVEVTTAPHPIQPRPSAADAETQANQAVAPPAPQQSLRTASGDTMTATNPVDSTTWDDEDHAAKTKVAAPFERPSNSSSPTVQAVERGPQPSRPSVVWDDRPKATNAPLLVLVVVLAVSAILALLYMLELPPFRNSAVQVTPLPSPSRTAPPAEVPEPAQAPSGSAPEPKPVKLRLATVPEGAEVYDGDVMVGRTPLPLERPSGSVVDLRFSVKGYRPLSRRVGFVADQELTLTLEREAR